MLLGVLYISIFLLAMVLQTDSPTECTDNHIFRVGSPTKPILALFNPTNRCYNSPVELLIGVQDQCIISPTFCRTIDTLLETSVS